jgi:hypothetical protein
MAIAIWCINHPTYDGSGDDKPSCRSCAGLWVIRQYAEKVAETEGVMIAGGDMGMDSPAESESQPMSSRTERATQTGQVGETKLFGWAKIKPKLLPFRGHQNLLPVWEHEQGGEG